MAWALDSVATPVVAISGTTVTLSHTLGGGSDRLVIVGAGATSRNVTGITYDSVAMTAVANPASGAHEARLFRMLDASLPGAGTYSVVITYDGALSSGFPGIGHCASFTGLLQQAAESAFGESYGNVSSITDDVTPATDAALIVSLLGVSDNRTVTPDSGQGAAISTLDTTSGLYRSRLYAWTGPTPAALLSSAFTLSSASNTNAQHVAAFGIVTAGGGGSPTVQPMRGMSQAARRASFR